MAIKRSNTKFMKEEQFEIGCNCQSREAREANYSKEYAERLEKELAGSYYWSGNFCKDYFFFICNWHPLLGMCLAHPAHPWSKPERIMTFIFSCCLTMVPSACWVYLLRKDPSQKSLSFVFIFIFVTLPVMIWEVALYWIAISDIFCRGRGCLCDMISKCFTCFKNCCICCSLTISLIVLGISYAIMRWADAPLKDLLRPFVYSRLQSWVTWFVIWTFLPYLGFLHGWCMEKSAAEKASPEESDDEHGDWDHERSLSPSQLGDSEDSEDEASSKCVVS